MKNAIQSFLKILRPVNLRPRLRATHRRIYYFGFKYKCPLCNSYLRKFLPVGIKLPVLKEKNVVGGGYRQTGLCPVCGSYDRERLVYLYLLNKTDIFKKPHKLLYIAPETKLRDILENQASVNCLTADLYSNNAMVQMNITDIQFPDNSFDAIICNHVLEHIIDDYKAMSELYRTLKSGGWAILQVPLSLSLITTYEDFSITTTSGREKAFGQMDHVRIYAKDYKDRLEKVGFNVNVFKWNTEAEKYGGGKNSFGLNEEENVYHANKPL